MEIAGSTSKSFMSKNNPFPKLHETCFYYLKNAKKVFKNYPHKQ
ncbi:hypothetical protein PNK_0222 [Candidatus Protochlamydia naegleriophila]|uniref:Uncharacterized protein n=1 Tax=Candidatus Protochlamydia naegleriophila TaxID=389348 RepID=A0A0U5EPH1_9BACT|nr:hypothetical protein PNK_0222 [Candidatus Protochlamydia naegleriophila]